MVEGERARWKAAEMLDQNAKFTTAMDIVTAETTYTLNKLAAFDHAAIKALNNLHERVKRLEAAREKSK